MDLDRLIVRDNPERNRFEIDLGDGSFAIAEYTLPAGRIMFTHTEVPEAHEGQGVGTKLIRFALDAARERGLKVIPICPFFAAYMQEHAEVQDLLDMAWRKRFGLPDAL
ncbi:MAG TPA: GNAT family N-acetyltransferase [Sphingomicrobium sp.]